MKLLRSPFGYLAALAVVLAGWVLGTVIAAEAWDSVEKATVQPITAQRVDAQSRSIAIFTDTQPDADVRCQADRTNEEVFTVSPSKINIAIDQQGTRWNLIGLLSRGEKGLRLACDTAGAGVDDARYGFAVVDGFSTSGRVGQILAIGGFFAGVGLAGATYFIRRSAAAKTSA